MACKNTTLMLISHNNDQIGSILKKKNNLIELKNNTRMKLNQPNKYDDQMYN